MRIMTSWRCAAFAVFTGCAIAALSFGAQVGLGALTPAAAQISLEFRHALSPYGVWRHHPRFGEVWLPRDIPRGWRPYEYGHWVYTDEWGWYWVSDESEGEWGWVVFHYGRWVFERGWGWFWLPGDEWAPAWVDWRYGDDYVGWAPLPPDDLLEAYEDEPVYWVFLPPRYLIAPRPRSHFLASHRRAEAFHRTRIVNRTLPVHGARIAVNPGIPAGFVARVTRRPLPAYRVRPHVIAGTHGVAGAVTGQPGRRGGANAAAIERSTTVIQAAPSSSAPPPLSKGERGRLGSHPPRAAQGAGAPAAAPQAPAAAPKAPIVTPPMHREPSRKPPVIHAPTQAAPATPKPAITAPPPVAHPTAPKVMHPAAPAVTHPAPPPATHRAPPPTVKMPPPVAQPPAVRAPAVHAPPPMVKKPPTVAHPPAVRAPAVHAPPPAAKKPPPKQPDGKDKKDQPK